MHGQSRPAETVLPGSVSLGSFNSTESFAGEEDVYGSVEEKMGSPAYLSTDVCLGQFQGHLGISNCFFSFSYQGCLNEVAQVQRSLNPKDLSPTAPAAQAAH